MSGNEARTEAPLGKATVAVAEDIVLFPFQITHKHTHKSSLYTARFYFPFFLLGM